MLEIVVETITDALAAESGGATQLDLKADFVEDGITPTTGMVERICQKVNIDVIVMVRTHANGMVLTPDDIAVMCTDIRLARDRGAAGFLLGAITPDGRIDKTAIRTFQDAAQDLPVNFHLAWELCQDKNEALGDLIDLQVNSIRTTGGQGLGGKAIDAIEQIKAFRCRAAGRIDMFLAGGISCDNISRLVLETGVLNAHAGSSVRSPENHKGQLTENKVRALRNSLDQALIEFNKRRIPKEELIVTT